MCQVQTASAPEQYHAFEAQHAAILKQGFKANPIPIPLADVFRIRGRPKRSVPHHLLERLRPQQAAVLGFMDDFKVPFDNNQAERDLRIVKLKQKISGCFRSDDRGEMLCRIRGYEIDLTQERPQSLEFAHWLIFGKFRLSHP